MELDKYNYKNKELNVEIDCYLDEDNNIWFRGRDVATILRYKKPRNAINDHVSSDDKILRDLKIGNQVYRCIFINESGLYGLLLGSEKHGSKEFKN